MALQIRAHIVGDRKPEHAFEEQPLEPVQHMAGRAAIGLGVCLRPAVLLLLSNKGQT